eukprot:TRINITY_DN44329_c0_g1_i1.p1 TRINITY_DN44329_c0_g1~~TRINITY_DN44329_c0_g1_i1.p1  ORF type:complete len:1115 (-),score=105.54 TRINITY_DN44329_c0_g1_i1:63-3407(-)
MGGSSSKAAATLLVGSPNFGVPPASTPQGALEQALVKISSLLGSREALGALCRDLYESISDDGRGGGVSRSGLRMLTRLVIDGCQVSDPAALQELLDVLAPLPRVAPEEVDDDAPRLHYDGFVCYARCVLRVVDAALRAEVSAIPESATASQNTSTPTKTGPDQGSPHAADTTDRDSPVETPSVPTARAQSPTHNEADSKPFFDSSYPQSPPEFTRRDSWASLPTAKLPSARLPGEASDDSACGQGNDLHAFHGSQKVLSAGGGGSAVVEPIGRTTYGRGGRVGGPPPVAGERRYVKGPFQLTARSAGSVAASECSIGSTLSVTSSTGQTSLTSTSALVKSCSAGCLTAVSQGSMNAPSTRRASSPSVVSRAVIAATSTAVGSSSGVGAARLTASPYPTANSAPFGRRTSSSLAGERVTAVGPTMAADGGSSRGPARRMATPCGAAMMRSATPVLNRACDTRFNTGAASIVSSPSSTAVLRCLKAQSVPQAPAVTPSCVVPVSSAVVTRVAPPGSPSSTFVGHRSSCGATSGAATPGAATPGAATPGAATPGAATPALSLTPPGGRTPTLSHRGRSIFVEATSRAVAPIEAPAESAPSSVAHLCLANTRALSPVRTIFRSVSPPTLTSACVSSLAIPPSMSTARASVMAPSSVPATTRTISPGTRPQAVFATPTNFAAITRRVSPEPCAGSSQDLVARQAAVQDPSRGASPEPRTRQSQRLLAKPTTMQAMARRPSLEPCTNTCQAPFFVAAPNAACVPRMTASPGPRLVASTDLPPRTGISVPQKNPLVPSTSPPHGWATTVSGVVSRSPEPCHQGTMAGGSSTPQIQRGASGRSLSPQPCNSGRNVQVSIRTPSPHRRDQLGGGGSCVATPTSCTARVAGPYQQSAHAGVVGSNPQAPHGPPVQSFVPISVDQSVGVSVTTTTNSSSKGHLPPGAAANSSVASVGPQSSATLASSVPVPALLPGASTPPFMAVLAGATAQMTGCASVPAVAMGSITSVLSGRASLESMPKFCPGSLSSAAAPAGRGDLGPVGREGRGQDGGRGRAGSRDRGESADKYKQSQPQSPPVYAGEGPHVLREHLDKRRKQLETMQDRLAKLSQECESLHGMAAPQN